MLDPTCRRAITTGLPYLRDLSWGSSDWWCTAQREMHTFPDKTWTIQAANANALPSSVFWMGLLVGAAELGTRSYRRVPVQPCAGDSGFLVIEALFEPDEAWNGITAVALWARPTGGEHLFVHGFVPTNAEPGYTLTMKLRVRDTADWKTLLSEVRSG